MVSVNLPNGCAERSQPLLVPCVGERVGSYLRELNGHVEAVPRSQSLNGVSLEARAVAPKLVQHPPVAVARDLPPG